MDVLARPRARFPTLQILLFLATVVTTVIFGAFLSDDSGALSGAHTRSELLAVAVPALENGLRFSACLLAILLAHEMGHFVTARRHGVDASLPYFIPVPLGVGTLGAVIRMRSAIPSRRAAIDIGAAGPLAGFALAIPVLLWGLAHSEVRAAAELASAPPASPALLAMIWRLMHGAPAVPPEVGTMVFGDSLVFRAAERLLLGPLPAGSDVFIHPVALAAWVGLLVTTLNLIPIGQLDGGHVAYALLGGRKARALGRLAAALLLISGFVFSWSWIVWWALSRYVVGLGHPPALDEEPLGPNRKLIAYLCLAVLAVTFVPVPVSL